jgi:hypothetical protein
MAIVAHHPANPLKQRFSTPPLAIIEFVLDQLPHNGTPGQLLHLSLTQNYIASPDQLHHELIFFNICDDDVLAGYTAEMAKTAERLQKRCVILLYFIFLLA